MKTKANQDAGFRRRDADGCGRDDRAPEGAATAFTLIELLAVIAIIAIIATMVVSMSKYASQIKTKSRVTTELSGLKTMIESYHSKLGFYPPDNGLLATSTNSTYDGLAATNPLFYELTGVTNTSGNSKFLVYNVNHSPTAPIVLASAYSNVFGQRGGVANADPTDPQDFYQPGPTPQECAPYYQNGTEVIYGLMVPAQLVANNTNNFWHYDASSAYRHNMNSFDLWAEYVVGSKYFTNGNW